MPRKLAVAVVIVVIALLASTDATAATKTFEELLASADDPSVAIENARAMHQSCGCKNEFEQKACQEQRQEGAKYFREKPILVLPLPNSELALDLGKFDFKKSAFPTTLSGGVAIDAAFESCTPGQSTEEDPCAGAWDFMESPASSVRLVLPATVWRGTLTVADEEVAKRLREAPDGIRGLLLVQVGGAQLRRTTNKKLAAIKATVLSEMDARIKPALARYGKEMVADVLERRRCAAKAPVEDVFVDISASAIGIRLETDVVGEYLVSMPRSETGLQERRAHEKAASEAEEAARVEAQRKAEEERANKIASEREQRRAHIVRTVDGGFRRQNTLVNFDDRYFVIISIQDGAEVKFVETNSSGEQPEENMCSSSKGPRRCRSGKAKDLDEALAAIERVVLSE